MVKNFGLSSGDLKYLKIKSSVMSGFVAERPFPDVSKVRNAFIFRVNRAKEACLSLMMEAL
jgi:hypothetical protein